MSGRREQTRTRLKKRCEALAGMITGIKPVYEDPHTSEDQRRFIETVIGAAVWYLPEVEECWTGMMSLAALRSHHPDSGGEPKLTKDHEYLTDGDLRAVKARRRDTIEALLSASARY